MHITGKYEMEQENENQSRLDSPIFHNAVPQNILITIYVGYTGVSKHFGKCWVNDKVGSLQSAIVRKAELKMKD
jgi:hypothetical protein